MSTAEYTRRYRLLHPEKVSLYSINKIAARAAARAEREKIVEKCPYCGNDFHPFNGNGNKRHPTCGSEACKTARALDLQHTRWCKSKGVESASDYVPKHATIAKKPVANKRICKICGKTFTTTNPYHRICSEACRKAARAQTRRSYYVRTRPERTEIICLFCGASFMPKTTKAKFCCAEHRLAYARGVRCATTPVQDVDFGFRQVERDMRLPAAERLKASRRWTPAQRKYAQRLYMSHHGLFRMTYNP